jgi:PadR family transcriptional regulator AphA
MAARPLPTLSPAEWSALGLVVEGAVHGYDVARELGVDGALGTVWTVPRPLVYRALQQLEADGYIRAAHHERSPSGPRRTVLEATPAGRRALTRWLRSPVEHVRDVRSVLLLKLALLDRRNGDPGALIEAQRRVIEELLAGLEERRRGAEGFDQVVAAWRIESARAVLRFLQVVAV